MKNQEAEQLRRYWSMSGFIGIVTLLSDQDRNVDGTVIKYVCAKYGIKKLQSSVYHPEGDGEVERMSQSFEQYMRLLEDRHISSPRRLPLFVFTSEC